MPSSVDVPEVAVVVGVVVVVAEDPEDAEPDPLTGPDAPISGMHMAAPDASVPPENVWLPAGHVYAKAKPVRPTARNIKKSPRIAFLIDYLMN